MCPVCMVPETVSHFLMDCRNFDEQRSDLRKLLTTFNEQFKDEQFFNINNILFPHLWVPLPDPDDRENYKDNWNAATNTRVAVISHVCNFVDMTQRFHGQDIL